MTEIETNSKRHIAKWGFGMAPISLRMRTRYDSAVQTGLDLLHENLPYDAVALGDLSELKGMFNRCIRQDQWDWFSVHVELGNPPLAQMRRIASSLQRLRRAFRSQDYAAANSELGKLIGNNLCQYLENYQNDLHDQDESYDSGWIYILSTREQDSILKIGMTRRSVVQRVNEINSATGVVFPYSARRVFRVKYVARTERGIHELLSQYRMRTDREFFELPFADAARLIEEYLEESRLSWRKRGEVVWFDHDKRFGFIASDDENDVFVHASEVSRDELALLMPKSQVEYDLWLNHKGASAHNVRLITDDD